MTDIEEQRQRVAEALAEAQRRTAFLARVLGVLIAGTGVALSYFVFVGMESQHTVVFELVFFATWMLLAGGILLLFGAGGAAQLQDIPRLMWGVFAGTTGVLALVGFIPLGRLLAHLAHFDGF